jgi:transcriptional regulator with XRE-family HTH domain
MARTAANAAAPATKGAIALAADTDRVVPSTEVDEIVQEIGPKVRALRAELGLSLQQMSAIADVSAASIHKIERGDMVPTITTLLKLAAAFRRPISYLINEQPGDPNDAWHTARGAGEPVQLHSGSDALRISGPAMRFRGEATIVKLAAGAVEDEPSGRPGEALVYVLAGGVEADIAGRAFTLRKGDSLHYMTDRTVSWSNGSRTPAEMLRISFPYS